MMNEQQIFTRLLLEDCFFFFDKLIFKDFGDLKKLNLIS